MGSANNNERTSKLEFKNLLAKNKTKELVTRLKEIYLFSLYAWTGIGTLIRKHAFWNTLTAWVVQES